jgi:hypothetical protein
MLSLNGREVTNVRLHSVIYIPGVGQMGTTLDANSSQKNGLGSMTMLKFEDGVLLKGKNFEAFVPNGNIICMTLSANRETSQAV